MELASMKNGSLHVFASTSVRKVSPICVMLRPPEFAACEKNHPPTRAAIGRSRRKRPCGSSGLATIAGDSAPSSASRVPPGC
jgi:hypothetical protein